jgi:uncharacterized protein (DUF1330 family)
MTAYRLNHCHLSDDAQAACVARSIDRSLKKFVQVLHHQVHCSSFLAETATLEQWIEFDRELPDIHSCYKSKDYVLFAAHCHQTVLIRADVEY